MTYDLLIKNGKVILENIVTVTDIAVKNGKIVAIGNDLKEGKEIIDAEGLIVSPGMIDAHMHISEPGRTEWEGYETGTRALAKGGATTCIEMPLNQLPATIDRKTLHTKFEAGREKLNVDVASFGGLVPHNLDRLHELAEEGVAAYKCFLSTCGSKKEGSIDFRNVDDYSFFKGLQTLGKLNKIVAVHCENATICDKLGEEAKSSGKTTAHDYVASRPVFAEVEAVRRAIYLAKEANCQLHICHISCPEAVEEVTIARQSGQKVTCESCGHYFALTTDEFEKIGNTAKCSPPIRDKENQNRMWEKVLKGEIDLIASDHSPCTPELKKGGVFEAWGGISAAQNTLDIFFDEAVQKRGMNLNLFAQLIATNPAKIFHLKNKGSITIGKDADFVLIKPNSSYVLKSEDLEYKNKISAYVGRTINAQVARTILRGKTIYELSKGIIEPHTGEFILCKNS